LLLEAWNILEGDADHNWSGRHSDVIVRGQRPYGHGADALEIEGKARDAEVDRFRPVVILNDGDTDKDRAGKRATHRRDREAGNGLKANITVQGFRDDGGMIWTPGNLVFTQSAFLDIAQDMAIESAVFSQERGDGSKTVLSLVDPRALGGKGAKGGKAGDAWGSDAGEGE
jgi:prophage tail gpP-like protein